MGNPESSLSNLIVKLREVDRLQRSPPPDDAHHQVVSNQPPLLDVNGYVLPQKEGYMPVLTKTDLFTNIFPLSYAPAPADVGRWLRSL